MLRVGEKPMILIAESVNETKIKKIDFEEQRKRVSGERISELENKKAL